MGPVLKTDPCRPRLNHRISQGKKLLLGEGHPMLDPSNFISLKLIKSFSSVTTDIIPAFQVIPELDLLLLVIQPVSVAQTIRNIIRFFINNYKICLSHILQQMALLFFLPEGQPAKITEKMIIRSITFFTLKIFFIQCFAVENIKCD